MVNDDHKRLEWTCEECKEPIADHRGYLHLELIDVSRYTEAKKEWELEHEPRSEGVHAVPLSAYETYPHLAHWRTHHTRCDPFPLDSGAYSIDVDRARTYAKLLAWTAQLMGKNWLEHTDWGYLIGAKSGWNL